MIWKKYASTTLAALASVLLATPAPAGVYNSTYEGSAGTHGAFPGSTAASLIDDHARNARQELRYRLEVEHFIGDQDGTADDNGLHRVGSARCYVQATAPTTLNDSHSTAAITDYDNLSAPGGGNDSGGAGLEDEATTSAGEIEDDIGHGRCWIDTDDYQMYIFVGEAGDNTPSTVADGWIPVQDSFTGGPLSTSFYRFSGNLVFHGSFDGTDGDGDPGATGTTTGMPYGWTNRFNSATGTHTYVDPVTVTEGEGLMYVHTTEGATGTDSGITQTLGGLKASTWYKFEVRASAATDDTCQLRVTGTGVTTLPIGQEVETATTGAFETLRVWAQTDSSANDLTMILQGPDSGDVCSWKHASVTERTESATSIGAIGYRSAVTPYIACNTTYVAPCADIVTVTVIPPGPGYMAQIHGKANYVSAVSGAQCFLELWENAVGTQLDESNASHQPLATPAIEVGSLHVNYLYGITEPMTAGTPYVFTLNAKADVNTKCIFYGNTMIEALLIPTGR